MCCGLLFITLVFGTRTRCLQKPWLISYLYKSCFVLSDNLSHTILHTGYVYVVFTGWVVFGLFCLLHYSSSSTCISVCVCKIVFQQIVCKSTPFLYFWSSIILMQFSPCTPKILWFRNILKSFEYLVTGKKNLQKWFTLIPVTCKASFL